MDTTVAMIRPIGLKSYGNTCKAGIWRVVLAIEPG